ncbi:MAG: hypothetical protein K2L72_01145, partial [Clostridia bacterium]|nr:hypothetical protein [Clostridia bacterium]
MKKPTVLFPYVEAGMGHIAPMKAIAKKFEELYGDVTDCREVKFFADSGNDTLREFERKMCKSVIDSNRNKSLGFFMTFNMNFWGAKIATAASANCLEAGTAKPAVERMDELAPDLVFSTHWSTNYFAVKSAAAPLTVLYCPDARLYPLFNYPCDLALVPTRAGYEEALKKYKRRYNKDNLKCVPALIREEAFSVPRDRRAVRESLGLDPDKFTVLLAEGGYGIGKMTEICRRVLKRDLNVTLIPVCGKNEELFNELSGWQSGGRCDFRPVGFTEKMSEYMAAADLFCGKSGANVFAEACFFGVPQIVTKYASGVEKLNGEYYVNKIKTALKIFNAAKVADKIEEFADNPEKLKPLREAAEAQREN